MLKASLLQLQWVRVSLSQTGMPAVSALQLQWVQVSLSQTGTPTVPAPQLRWVQVSLSQTGTPTVSVLRKAPATVEAFGRRPGPHLSGPMPGSVTSTMFPSPVGRERHAAGGSRTRGGTGLFLLCWVRAFFSAVGGVHRPWYGKSFELPVAPVTEQIVSEQDLGKDRCRPITSTDTAASAFWAFLRDHSYGSVNGSCVGIEQPQLFDLVTQPVSGSAAFFGI
jgi:hypothetical protein